MTSTTSVMFSSNGCIIKGCVLISVVQSQFFVWKWWFMEDTERILLLLKCWRTCKRVGLVHPRPFRMLSTTHLQPPVSFSWPRISLDLSCWRWWCIIHSLMPSGSSAHPSTLLTLSKTYRREEPRIFTCNSGLCVDTAQVKWGGIIIYREYRRVLVRFRITCDLLRLSLLLIRPQNLEKVKRFSSIKTQ